MADYTQCSILCAVLLASGCSTLPITPSEADPRRDRDGRARRRVPRGRVDGAQPGIVVLAEPRPGLAYRQELAPDVAEDMGRVLGLNASVEVPYGEVDDCLHTMEWTPLERGIREHKFYCRGIGLVLEVQPAGGRIRNELVAITHFPATG